MSAITSKLNATAATAEEEEEDEIAFGYSVEVASRSKQVEHIDSSPSPLSSVTLSISIQQISIHMLSHMEHDGESFQVTTPSPAPQTLCFKNSTQTISILDNNNDKFWTLHFKTTILIFVS